MKLLASHCQDFATSADLDGVSRTVEATSHWMERTFWLLTCCMATIAAILLTSMVSLNYIGGASYDTSYNIHTEDGLVTFPDILMCTSSLWDLAKVRRYNISSNLLAYLSNFIFPIGGFSSEFPPQVSPIFYALEEEYKAVVEKFDRNAMYLLHNITKTCSQVVDLCYFGNIYSVNSCCKFFNPGEFILGQLCFRTNQRLFFAVKEAGSINSIAFKITLNGSALAGSNVQLLNPPARMLSGGVSAAVSDKQSHTYLSLARQDILTIL